MDQKVKHLIKKGLSSVKENGVKQTCFKVLNYCIHNNRMQMTELLNEQNWEEYADNLNYDEVKFSILVPLYNTSETFLQEMIESVQHQTYENWELCLADGSDDAHSNVKAICEYYAKRDARIKYRKLEANLGISGNSNMALQMADGDYIALFDHDDLLHPKALMEVAKRIAKQNADFIYTDEAVFISNLDNIISVHRKPDYAPDNLRANNHICHFSVFSKKLLEKTEAFRSEYDGSQDHDLILRLTAVAERIVHIPKILYYWRSHAESVASGIGAKSYAVKAGQNAVKDYLKSVGEPCTIESLDFCPTIYRIKYELLGMPLVSILLNVRSKKDVNHYIENIINRNSYKNCKYYFLCDKQEIIDILEKKLNNACNYYIVRCDKKKTYVQRIEDTVNNNIEGEYVVLMERRLTPLSENWIEELLMYAQRADVGLVGSKVYYKNGLIKSAAVAFKGDRNSKNIKFLYKYHDKCSQGYMGKLQYAQNVDAVTSDCIMIKKEHYFIINKLEKTYEKTQHTSINWCRELHAKGLLIVWNPYAEFLKSNLLV